MGCTPSTDNVSVSSQKVEQFHDKYQLFETLGKGAFAQVRLARCVDTDKAYAVKILEPRGEEDGERHIGRPTRQRLRPEFVAELKAWSHVSCHPNIVCLREAFQDTDFGYFVMEKCARTLLDGLKKESELNEAVYVRYFQEMLAAIEHIHEAGMVHRDIKQDNFLLGGSTCFQVKLCDFGFSAILPSNGNLRGVFGTAPYMAPEMLQKRNVHGQPSDMWSLGVIVYSLFFGGFPYNPEEKTSAGMKAVIREGVPEPTFQASRGLKQDPVSEEAKTFCMALLNRDPLARPSAKQALNMKYIAKPDSSRNKEGLTSLQLMLHGAIRSGAFSTRAPKSDPTTNRILEKLQAAGAQSRCRRLVGKPTKTWDFESVSTESGSDSDVTSEFSCAGPKHSSISTGRPCDATDETMTCVNASTCVRGPRETPDCTFERFSGSM